MSDIDSAIHSLRMENVILRALVVSLFQAHPDRQAVLESFAARLDDLSGLGLYSESFSDGDLDEFRAACVKMTIELDRAPVLPSRR